VSAAEDLLARAYDAMNRRDFEELAAITAPDFELDLSARVFNPATYRGLEGVRQFLSELEDLWQLERLEVERMLVHDDEALVIVTIKLLGRGSGLPMDNRVAHRWWMQDGRLLRLWGSADVDAAVADFEAG
jgi:ketosteroid isomerase-like protein